MKLMCWVPYGYFFGDRVGTAAMILIELRESVCLFCFPSIRNVGSYRFLAFSGI